MALGVALPAQASDYSVGELSGIGVTFSGAGGAGPQIVVSHTIRAEGDVLSIEGLDGADNINAAAVATGRSG